MKSVLTQLQELLTLLKHSDEITTQVKEQLENEDFYEVSLCNNKILLKNSNEETFIYTLTTNTLEFFETNIDITNKYITFKGIPNKTYSKQSHPVEYSFLGHTIPLDFIDKGHLTQALNTIERVTGICIAKPEKRKNIVSKEPEDITTSATY